jgi:hypothetical protein
MANPMGKTRKVEQPYLIVTDTRTGFVYHVLKANTANPGKPGGSWFCAVKSPYTFGGWDMGDTYICDVQGTVTFRDPVVTDDLLPLHLGGKVAVAKNPMDAFVW